MNTDEIEELRHRHKVRCCKLCRRTLPLRQFKRNSKTCKACKGE